MLIEVELQAHREKGLYYHCNEKFEPNHHYKTYLQILLVYDDDK